MNETDLVLDVARDWGLWGAALAFAGVVFWRLIWPEVVLTREYDRECAAQEREFKQEMRRLQIEFYGQALTLMQGISVDLVDIRLAIERLQKAMGDMPAKDW